MATENRLNEHSAVEHFGPYSYNEPNLSQDQIARFFPKYEFTSTGSTSYALSDATTNIKTYLNISILRAKEPYTTEIFPFKSTTSNNIDIRSWEYIPGSVPNVPERGVAPLARTKVTHLKRTQKRMGKGFQTTQERWNTAEGQMEVIRIINGIVVDIHVALSVDVLSEIRRKKYLESFVLDILPTGETYERVISFEMSIFNSARRNSFGLTETIGKRITYLSEKGVKSNIILVGPGQTSIVLGTSKKYQTNTNTKYWGLSIVDLNVKEEIESARAQGEFDGHRVFETKDYIPRYATEPQDTAGLGQWINVGEYNIMKSSGSSCKKDIYIRDFNSDDWVKIEFLKALENSNIFSENNDDYTESLYNYKEFKNRTSKDRINLGHPFITFDNDGQYKLVECIGEMLDLDENQLKKIVDSTLESLFNFQEKSEAIDILNCAKQLKASIDSEIYCHEYALAWVEANLAYSIDSNDEFIGEKTPSYIAENWNTIPITEWKPNENGSYNLPQPIGGKNSFKCKYPIGYSTFQGMCQIATESDNPKSYWYNIGLTAKRIVNFFTNLASKLQQAYPTSSLLDACNSYPWNLRPTMASTLYDCFIGRSQCPIFVLHATPKSMDGKKVDGQTFGNSSKKNAIDWNHIPYFKTKKGQFLNKDEQKYLESKYGSLKFSKDMKSTGSPIRTVYMSSHMNLALDIDLMAKFLRNRTTGHFSDEIKIMSFMGDESAISFQNILNIISMDGEPELLRTKFISVIFKTLDSDGIVGARKLVRALNVHENSKSIRKDILILFSDGVDDKSSKAADKLRKNLLATSFEHQDDDLVTFYNDEYLPSVEMVGTEIPTDITYSEILPLLDEFVTLYEKYPAVKTVDEPFVVGVSYNETLLKTYFKGPESKKIISLYMNLQDLLEQVYFEKYFKQAKESHHNGNIHVYDVDEAMIGKKYYRTSLVMSRTLLESIGKLNHIPFFLPGDYERNFLEEKLLGHESLSQIHIKSNVSYLLNHHHYKMNKSVNEKIIGSPLYERMMMFKSKLFSDKKNISMSSLRRDLKGGNHNSYVDSKKMPNLHNWNYSIYDRIYGLCENLTLLNSMISHVAIHSESSLHQFKCMLNHDIHIPFDILLNRPSITFWMYDVVIMQGGSETGNTYFLPYNTLAIGLDSKTHTINGSIQFYARPILEQPNNVTIIPNAVSGGYGGGYGKGFIQPEEFNNLDLSDKERPSCIAMVVSCNTEFTPSITLRGFDPTKVNHSQSEYLNHRIIGSAEYYDHLYRFPDPKEHFDKIRSMDTEERFTPYAPILGRGAQFSHSYITKRFDIFTKSNSHIGSNGVSDNALSVWQGTTPLFNEFDPRRIVLE